MGLQYVENPVLFVNSGANFAVPNGRNARIKHRTQQAAIRNVSVTTEDAHFGVINFRRRRPRKRKDVSARRKSRAQTGHPVSEEHTSSECVRTALYAPLRIDYAVAANPAKVLAVATFHIRRSAAIALKRNPDRLAEILRCRQWSSLSIPSDRLGQCRCLDNALTCVASKLLQITGGPMSNYFTLLTYTQALHNLQAALAKPRLYNIDDLRATIQLLAVFEMLDSIDNAAWRQHVNGAEILSLSRGHCQTGQAVVRRSAVSTLPMVADAMLNGDGNFFEVVDWRTPIHALVDESKEHKDLALCLSDVPDLLINANRDFEFGGMSATRRYELLDRAHAVKVQLRAELLKSNLYERFACGEETSLDELGLHLAGLVSLDRLISWLRPVQMRARELEKDETAELCAQMLRLELRASDAYPPSDLLSAFQSTAT